MIDVFNLPSLTENSKVFFANGSSWQVWNKPSNCKFVYIFSLGGGGGGGGCRTGAVNTATGGGGGGSSAIAISLFIANLLPDNLYIQVGLGGIGGIASVGGNSGTLSYISTQPNTTALNILMQNGSAGAGAGNAGTSSVAGVGGVGGTAWVYNPFVFGNLGLVTTNIGQAGVIGGATSSNGTNITPTLCVTGGAGGGGVSSSSPGASHLGGNIIGSGFLNTIVGGVNDVTDNSVNGNNGYQSLNSILTSCNMPMFFTGGAGGGACNTSARIGGAGGSGAYGSGGGGGGGSYNALGGAGGNGGDGLVLITCY